MSLGTRQSNNLAGLLGRQPVGSLKRCFYQYQRGNFIYVNMLNAQKVLALNVDALLISFICMLMLLILSLHQERTDRDEIKRFSFFGNEISLLETLTLMTSNMAFCLYLMNKMQGNLIMKRSCTTFKWFNWFDRLCIK